MSNTVFRYLVIAIFYNSQANRENFCSPFPHPAKWLRSLPYTRGRRRRAGSPCNPSEAKFFGSVAKTDRSPSRGIPFETFPRKEFRAGFADCFRPSERCNRKFPGHGRSSVGRFFRLRRCRAVRGCALREDKPDFRFPPNWSPRFRCGIPLACFCLVQVFSSRIPPSGCGRCFRGKQKGFESWRNLRVWRETVGCAYGGPAYPRKDNY